ncbi:TOMM precursor leader peptide-binding protein [Streptomyces hiroshimensis]|uniref:TOMM precursor leader peptide-binding protein n=1 Tax=Streptomyces hiroshimensis TaxID=66424 RepID=UPI0016739994|nr:TOMM precursor leader peptide-binding protein [Streptomyces hiroshimensis]
MRTSRNMRIKRSVTVVGHSPDMVELRTGVWNAQSFVITDHARSGKLFSVVKGLDGALSRGELAKREDMPRTEVEAIVDHLDQLGLVEQEPATALDAYLDHVETLAAPQDPPPTDRPVYLLGGSEPARAVAAHLAGLVPSGVTEVPADDPARQALDRLAEEGAADSLRVTALCEAAEAWRDGLVVSVMDQVDPPHFQALNRMALEVGFPWVHGVVDGPFLFVGPTFVPGRSACYSCFERRVTMNLRESASYLAYKDALARGAVRRGRPAVLGAVAALLASHTALEVVNFLHTGSTFTIEKTLGIYLPSMEISYSEVLPLPGCPECGSLPERDDSTLYFDPRTWLHD